MRILHLRCVLVVVVTYLYWILKFLRYFFLVFAIAVLLIEVLQELCRCCCIWVVLSSVYRLYIYLFWRIAYITCNKDIQNVNFYYRKIKFLKPSLAIFIWNFLQFLRKMLIYITKNKSILLGAFISSKLSVLLYAILQFLEKMFI